MLYWFIRQVWMLFVFIISITLIGARISAQEIDPREEAFRGTYTNAPYNKTYGTGVVITFPKSNDPTAKFRDWKALRTNRLQELAKQITLKVNFEFDEAKLNTEAINSLISLSHLLKNNPDAGLLIVGHTDLVGSYDYNDKLSKDRADSVELFLTSNGISKDRIFKKASGEYFPIINTIEKNFDNRRVEISLVDMFLISE